MRVIMALCLLAALTVGCGEAGSDRETSQLSLNQFTESLTDAGLSVGDRSEKLYGMLMAVDGFAVDVNGTKIEVYQYDTSIESGRDALTKFAAQGVAGTRTITHKNLMLLENEQHADWAAIVQAMRSL